MNEELDLKLDELFRWKGKIDLYDRNGEVLRTLYVRVISDEDARKTRIQALKESRLLREKLLDRESDEYLAFMPIKSELSRDEMLVNILFSAYSDLRRRAESSVSEKVVRPPKDGADLEAHEQYIEDLGNARRDYLKQVGEKTGELAEDLRQTLDAKSDEELFAEYERVTINRYCTEKMNNVYNEYAIMFATYEDPEYKVRAFDNIDDVRNLSVSIKQQIVDGYLNIQLGLDEVKK